MHISLNADEKFLSGHKKGFFFCGMAALNIILLRFSNGIRRSENAKFNLWLSTITGAKYILMAHRLIKFFGVEVLWYFHLFEGVMYLKALTSSLSFAVPLIRRAHLRLFLWREKSIPLTENCARISGEISILQVTTFGHFFSSCFFMWNSNFRWRLIHLREQK